MRLSENNCNSGSQNGRT